MMKLIATGMLLIGSFAQAGMVESMENLRRSFVAGGGTEKAFNQALCYLQNHSGKTYRSKRIGTDDETLVQRCNNKNLRLQNENAVVIVDYTQLSNRPRFYLFDLRANRVHFLHTAHGRYGDTPRSNTEFSTNPKRNSILRVAHFSNVVNSNASAGGFYLTGDEYQGMYKRSLILHGIEGDVNDNSCERMTVVHRSSKIKENATELMSSGCPMVALNKIDLVIDAMVDGALFYIYTPAEAAMKADECGRNLLE